MRVALRVDLGLDFQREGCRRHAGDGQAMFVRRVIGRCQPAAVEDDREQLKVFAIQLERRARGLGSHRQLRLHPRRLGLQVEL